MRASFPVPTRSWRTSRGSRRISGRGYRRHINESYSVTVSLPESPVYLLQRVNARVFPRPDQVMENVARVTTHLRARLQAEHLADWQRRTLQLVPTTSGAPWLADRPDDTWRMFVFIAGAVATEHHAAPDDGRAR